MLRLRQILLILTLLLCMVDIAFVCYDHVFYPVKFEKEIAKSSSEFGVEKALIISVINVESGFKENAKSASGAIGLMQIMPSTATWIAKELNEEYNEDCLYIPEYNIRFGTFYLNYLLNKFQNLDMVLACYNAGEGRVLEWINGSDSFNINKVQYKETANYILKVKNKYKIYKNKL